MTIEETSADVKDATCSWMTPVPSSSRKVTHLPSVLYSSASISWLGPLWKLIVYVAMARVFHSEGSAAFELRDELDQRQIERGTDSIQLDQVEPPLALLVVRHEGLAGAEPVSKLRLPQAEEDPPSFEHPTQTAVVVAVDGLLHVGSVDSRLPYTKIGFSIRNSGTTLRAMTGEQRAERRAKNVKAYAETPNWALWTFSIVGLVLAVTPAFVVGFIFYGQVAAALAARKGRTKLGRWMAYGMFIFPVAIIHALVMKPTPEAEHERRASVWATTPEPSGICGYTDEFAPGPCLKPRGHHLQGIDRSPHDYRPQTQGSAF